MFISRYGRSWWRLTSGLVFGLCLSSTAMAADIAFMPTKAIVPPSAFSNPWAVSFTPYAWTTLLNGSTTVKGRTADVDVGFNDLWCGARKSRKTSWHSWDISKRAMAGSLYSPMSST